MKYNPQLTLTSNNILYLEAVEGCLPIHAPPVELLGQGVGEAVLHNPPHRVFNVDPADDTQSSNLRNKKTNMIDTGSISCTTVLGKMFLD